MIKQSKIIASFTFSIMMLLTCQNVANSIPTKWEDAKMSMSELINHGWQVTAHGSNRVAANSNSGNGFDEATFSFLLTKQGNYIICFVDNPNPPIANTASCRKIN